MHAHQIDEVLPSGSLCRMHRIRYEKCLALIPSEPHILSRISFLCDAEGDKEKALLHHEEAYRCFPSNIDIIYWLGIYYVDIHLYKKAAEYFKKALNIEPNNLKWSLLIAGCYRRSGNYKAALEIYKDIHERFPDNIESLRFLVKLALDLGLEEVDQYLAKLKKTENWKYEVSIYYN